MILKSYLENINLCVTLVTIKISYLGILKERSRHYDINIGNFSNLPDYILVGKLFSSLAYSTKNRVVLRVSWH